MGGFKGGKGVGRGDLSLGRDSESPLGTNLRKLLESVYLWIGYTHHVRFLPVIFRHTVVIYKPIRSVLITLGTSYILYVLVSLQEVASVRISDTVRLVI